MTADERDAWITQAILSLVKTEPRPDPYAGERVHVEPGICMRKHCGEPRWKHPEKGDLVVCEYHAEEIFSGAAKAPPLRQGFDYQSIARKTFITEELPTFPFTWNTPPKEPKK